MAYYRFQLQAGKAFTTAIAGRVILIDDLGGASGLDITPHYGGRDLPTMPDRKKAFKFMEPFDGVTLKAATDCNVGIFLSASDVSLGFADGSLVNVSGQVQILNDVSKRVPVDIGGSNVNVTADNVGVSNTEANPVPTRPKLAAVVSPKVPKDATEQAVQLIAADAARRGLRIRNSGQSAVAIGGVGIVFAQATDVIQPGETWNENEAPGAEWYCVCDAGSVSTLNISVIQ